MQAKDLLEHLEKGDRTMEHMKSKGAPIPEHQLNQLANDLMHMYANQIASSQVAQWGTLASRDTGQGFMRGR